MDTITTMLLPGRTYAVTLDGHPEEGRIAYLLDLEIDATYRRLAVLRPADSDRIIRYALEARRPRGVWVCHRESDPWTLELLRQLLRREEERQALLAFHAATGSILSSSTAAPLEVPS